LLDNPSTVDLTARQERTCKTFALFLREHRTDVGDILSHDTDDPWTPEQMDKLVDIIKASGDEHRMIDFFRLLRKLVVCWMMRHGKEAPLPKSAIPIPDVANPSRINLAAAFRDYRNWAAWLASELEKARPSRKFAALPPINSVVPLLASSILYGGLWNEQSLVKLLRTLPNLLSTTMTTQEAIYIGLTLSWHNLPLGEFRCWQPDPLTAILLLRTDRSAVERLLQPKSTSKSGKLSDAELIERVKEQFQNLGSEAPGHAKLKRLLTCARTIGANCMPAVIARYAGRKYISPSLSLKQMQRISDKEWLYGLPFPAAAQSAADTGGPAPGVLLDAPIWAGMIESAILRRDLAAATAELDTLARRDDLPPLAVRLIDHARRTIVLPMMSRTGARFELFARRTLILAAAMYHQWAEADPAKLNDKELEAGYQGLVNFIRGMDPFGETLRDLMHGLKYFHSYMRNCQGKRRLKDKGLIVPMSVLDRIDVGILSLREYQRLQGEINLKWPGIEHEARRVAAHALTSFGFHMGTRREEGRLAKMGDLQPTEFLVRASSDDTLGSSPAKGRLAKMSNLPPEESLVHVSGEHTLKSPAAERRLPDICIPEHENAALRKWHDERSSFCGAGDYLFSDKLDGYDPVPPSIFRALNHLIAKVTGTSDSNQPSHYHHLRHRAASFFVLRMLLPSGAKPPDYLQREDAEWLVNGADSSPAELRRRTQPWGADLFLAGQLLGHLHPATTVRYSHFASELLRIYLQRSPWMQPAGSMLSSATGCAPNVPELDAPSAMQFAIEMLGKKARSDPRSRSTDSQPQRPQVSSFYRELLETREFLRYVQTADGPVEEAREFFGWRLERAKAVIKVAEQLHSMKTRIGSFRHRFQTARPEPGISFSTLEPAWPSDPMDRRIFESYAARIEEQAKGDETRAVLLRGIDAYVNAVWMWSNFAVFHDPNRKGNKAAAFLGLLDSLQIHRKDIRFISFDKKRSQSRRGWKESLRLGRNTRFERRSPPYGDPKSTQPWIAIEPKFGAKSHAGGGLFGFRCLLVTSFIALSARVE
jgi:hypothetical protein